MCELIALWQPPRSCLPENRPDTHGTQHSEVRLTLENGHRPARRGCLLGLQKQALRFAGSATNEFNLWDVANCACRIQTVVSRCKSHYVNIIVSLLVGLFLAGAPGFSE